MAKTPTASGAGVTAQVLRAKDVTVPITTGQDQFPPELLKLRADFLAGKQLSPQDMSRLLVASAEGGGNGNCNIC